MRAVIVTTEKNPQALRKLQALGVRTQMQSPEKIQSLERDSTDLVYLVPNALLQATGWNEHRVRLARASRRYIVFGHELDTNAIMNAARDGAHDVLDSQTDDDARWTDSLENAANAQNLWWQLYGGQGEVDEQKLIGRSSAMKTLRESVQRLGPTDATVLILGESGTGKERLAEAIHAAAAKGPFVAINCAALPADLLESELFGAEKGAYTGADRAKPGLVEEAASGTLFLDEIGELPLGLQPKLLRFLETRMARRVGSTKEYRAHARVISASNRDLSVDAESGRFRLDLFYRLSEVILNAPPLRQRPEDIPDLARAFLRQAAVRVGKNFEMLEPELIHRFQQYDWPGNVRELKQAIERLAFHYDGPVMRAAWWEVPPARDARAAAAAVAPAVYAGGLVASMPTPASMPPPGTAYPAPAYSGFGPPAPSRRGRVALAKKLLLENSEDLTWVAAQAGVHPTTLYRWRKSGKI
ncbi:MAG TPA: sigma-54 dependent transcriptional regulator [Opitutales bacterium]|jgi:two-component system response regulator AtoC|nr:sigma-54 dependent transcriptional regulator [Opitutales bacterium]